MPFGASSDAKGPPRPHGDSRRCRLDRPRSDSGPRRAYHNRPCVDLSVYSDCSFVGFVTLELGHRQQIAICVIVSRNKKSMGTREVGLRITETIMYMNTDVRVR